MVERDAREGVLERDGERWRLRFVRRLAHPRDLVWRALTEERHLAAWFPTTIEGDLRTGAELRFAFRDGAYPAHTGRMIEYDPPSAMEFAWGPSEDGEDEDHEVTRLELRELDAGCELTLLTTYDRVGKSARDAAGWHVCLDLLEADLRGDREQPSAETWAPWNRRYEDLFGPDASSIAAPDPAHRED